MKLFPTRIERLENRIAPAAISAFSSQIAADASTESHQDAAHFSPAIVPGVPATFVNAKTATYTDVDGDKVTVQFSNSILTATNTATILVTAASGEGYQLEEIDLTSVAAAAKGTSITVSAVPTATEGDGLANVGEIVATGIDLGKVTVHGDLGLILAGADSGAKDVALQALTVNSLGVFGSSTGAAATVSTDGNYDTTVLAGSVGPIAIHGDAMNIRLDLMSSLATTPVYSFGNISIGGNLESTTNSASEIYTQLGSFGAIKIGGSVNSAPIHNSGSGKIGSITIGGSVDGDATEFYTLSGAIGPVKIGGSILNDDMQVSGSSVASLTVGGSVSGLDLYSGGTGKIGPVKIGGSDQSTFIGDGPIASVTIGGSASDLDINNNIGGIGPVQIGGSLDGGSTIKTLAGSIASISIKGDLTAEISSEIGIGSVKVGGTVDATQILVGYGASGAFYTKSVQLGSLTVAGDWVASDVAVGVINLGSDDALGGTGTAADNVNFGNSDDSLFTAAGSTAKIGAISIGGEVLGTPNTTGDSFAFVAGQIASFKSGGVTIPLKAGPGNDDRALGLSGDVSLKEIARMVPM